MTILVISPHHQTIPFRQIVRSTRAKYVMINHVVVVIKLMSHDSFPKVSHNGIRYTACEKYNTYIRVTLQIHKEML